jgi:ribosome biogenesis GTPase A
VYNYNQKHARGEERKGMKPKVVVMLIGAPAAGKSTTREKLYGKEV